MKGASQIGCHGSAFSDHRGAYLNGMFGVVKPGRFTTAGEPVLGGQYFGSQYFV